MSVNLSDEYIQRVANVIRTKLTDASKEELQDLAEACIYRLRSSGIKKLNPDDPIVRQAIYYYAKANYGYDDDKDKYKKDFEELRLDMSVDSEYTSGEEWF